jgi:carbonic anhydrase
MKNVNESAIQFHEVSTSLLPETLDQNSRRRFLQVTTSAALAGLTTSVGMKFAPRPVQAQSILTPDAALTDLLDGNRRFTSGQRTSDQQDLAILKQKTIEKQEPFAAALSCADSRVPVELVFDQSIGHVFVPASPGMWLLQKLPPVLSMEPQFWA